MKNLKFRTALVLLALLLSLASCNNRRETGAGIESDIENPPTSLENGAGIQGTATDSAASKRNSERNDAMKLSDGKDSVDGEVTPPKAADQ